MVSSYRGPKGPSYARAKAPAPAATIKPGSRADRRTLTDQIVGPDGPLALLLIDQRPRLTLRSDPAERADPFYSALLGMAPVTTISQPPAPAYPAGERPFTWIETLAAVMRR